MPTLCTPPWRHSSYLEMHFLFHLIPTIPSITGTSMLVGICRYSYWYIWLFDKWSYFMVDSQLQFLPWFFCRPSSTNSRLYTTSTWFGKPYYLDSLPLHSSTNNMHIIILKGHGNLEIDGAFDWQANYGISSFKFGRTGINRFMIQLLWIKLADKNS